MEKALNLSSDRILNEWMNEIQEFSKLTFQMQAEMQVCFHLTGEILGTRRAVYEDSGLLGCHGVGVPDPEDKCDTVLREVEDCGIHDTTLNTPYLLYGIN